MYLIQCDYDCLYQDDGYCKLKAPTVVTNHNGEGCAHYIKLKANNNDLQIKNDNISVMPQMPL